VNERSRRENPDAGEQDLVRQVQEGDRDAFEVLVLKYQERVFRLISRLLGDREQIEDLAQEVFIRVFRALDGFKGDSSFYTWLYKIVLNTCRNYYRSMARRPEGSKVDSEKVFGSIEAKGNSPEREAIRAEFWDSVKGSLEELPREQREAVVLCDLEGLSYEEISLVAGIPVGTVRSRVFRGRRGLQRRMKPYLRATL
jgi:RNA polymerase sigma-70 factor (ECF subfamily)